MTICTELHRGLKRLFSHKLPAMCVMSHRGDWFFIPKTWRAQSDEFKLCRAMVGKPHSGWLQWLDTSEVKELTLPGSLTDEEKC